MGRRKLNKVAVCLSISEHTDETIDKLKETIGTSRGTVVDLAVKDYAKKILKEDE